MPGGYLPGTPADRIDAYRFRESLARARTTADPDERAAVLRAGLDVWRGPALADVARESLRRRLAGDLDEFRLTAREWWLAARPHWSLAVLVDRLSDERWTAWSRSTCWRSPGSTGPGSRGTGSTTWYAGTGGTAASRRSRRPSAGTP